MRYRGGGEGGGEEEEGEKDEDKEDMEEVRPPSCSSRAVAHPISCDGVGLQPASLTMQLQLFRLQAFRAISAARVPWRCLHGPRSCPPSCGCTA